MTTFLEYSSIFWNTLQALANESDVPFIMAAVATWPVTAWFIIQDRREARKTF